MGPSPDYGLLHFTCPPANNGKGALNTLVDIVCACGRYCLPGARFCKAAQDFWWERRTAIEGRHFGSDQTFCDRKYDYKPMNIPHQVPELYKSVQWGCDTLPNGCAVFR
eukprot:1168324-Pyramimonas_sp.AAC.2